MFGRKPKPTELPALPSLEEARAAKAEAHRLKRQAEAIRSQQRRISDVLVGAIIDSITERGASR